MEARLLRQQAMSQTRRALVLDAARAVFEEHGIEGASIREIARRAGYTPGAIYSYFESKEAIYGALLAESLDRLNTAVSAAQPEDASAAAFLKAKALGWFGFYAANPRELDLGFYLVHGLAPRGLTSELNQRLNARLHEALAPCEQALLAMGLDAAARRARKYGAVRPRRGPAAAAAHRPHPDVQAGRHRSVRSLPRGACCCAPPLAERTSPMLLDADESQLLLVDYQERLMPSIHDREAVLRNAMRLGRMAQMLERARLGHRGKSRAAGREPARAAGPVPQDPGQDALQRLRRRPDRAAAGAGPPAARRQCPQPAQTPAKAAAARNATPSCMAGCETHVCFLQTALDLLDEEFEVWVVTDACGSRTERNRDAAFDRLAGAGAELVTTEMVAFEWLRTAEHPLFKEVLSLIK